MIPHGELIPLPLKLPDSHILEPHEFALVTFVHRDIDQSDYSRSMTERESITYEERYVGARITANVLKAFCAFWIIAGIFILFRTDSTYKNVNSSDLSLLIVLAIEGAATLLGAAMFAFLAYVLDLLRGIWEESAGEND